MTVDPETLNPLEFYAPDELAITEIEELDLLAERPIKQTLAIRPLVGNLERWRSWRYKI